MLVRLKWIPVMGLLMVLMSVAGSQVAAAQMPEARSGEDRATSSTLNIGPGDLLQVNVFETPELSGPVRVSNAGDVNLPLIGDLHLQGLNATAAADSIRKTLMDGGFMNNPQVSVLIVEYATQQVSVLGEVKKPGVYPSMGEHHLLDYLSLAGGLTELAGNSVTITGRGLNPARQTIKLSNASTPSEESNPIVQPGATVYVEKVGIVYVVGGVTHPGGFILDRDGKLSVLKVIALAQGLVSSAAKNRALLMRKTPDGGQTETPLQVGKILAAKQPDVQLQDGDMIYIPNSAMKVAAGRVGLAALTVTGNLAVYRWW
jgi:polysaccharide export outer membrane protein